MPRRITFLCGLLLALSMETATEVLRADVLNRDGLPAHFITKPVSPSGATRQSSAGVNNGLYTRTCDELWYQRNALLWSAGYCFHEPRAVRVFGNIACGYDRAYEVPLTGQDSQLISLLELVENAKGCAP
jgi:YARHG domain-containing protein